MMKREKDKHLMDLQQPADSCDGLTGPRGVDPHALHSL
jgi:hypothetical protein